MEDIAWRIIIVEDKVLYPFFLACREKMLIVGRFKISTNIFSVKEEEHKINRKCATTSDTNGTRAADTKLQ